MSITSNISAYILCGGKSSRMQIEKGLVQYKNKPFIQWIIDAVEPITKDISLVTDIQDYAVFNYPLVADIYKNKGPVGGIYSALNHTKTDYNLILSCDVPNISTEVIETYLIKNLTLNKDVIYLTDNKKDFPLVALYHKRIAPNLHYAIKANTLKLISLINELESIKISVDEVHNDALLNINRKTELMNLEKKRIEIS